MHTFKDLLYLYLLRKMLVLMASTLACTEMKELRTCDC